MKPLSDAWLDHLVDVAARPEIPGGRYDVLELVGAGGMGAVYRAHDRALDRDVAIKVAYEPRADRGLGLVLREEARLAAALEHPSIAPVHDVGELADGRWYYVMRFVRGKTLAERAPKGLQARLRVFLQLCDALAHAHEQGLVHRDLKPANIMLGEHGELYVMDWGIARALPNAGRGATRDAAFAADRAPSQDAHGDARANSGGRSSRNGADDTDADERTSARSGDGATIAGTPGFMAPEQLTRPDADVGPRVDVYALGGILAFLASGCAPARDGGVELRGLQRPLAAIVEKARRSDARERYASAAELGRDVAAFLDREPVSAHREHIGEKTLRFVAKHQFVVWLVAGYLTLRICVFVFARR